MYIPWEYITKGLQRNLSGKSGKISAKRNELKNYENIEKKGQLEKIEKNQNIGRNQRYLQHCYRVHTTSCYNK